eukprot:jgi/Astpho2/4267/fgenesh1_pg.00064_%23_62_t
MQLGSAGSQMTLERSLLASHDRRAFEELVAQDGFYAVRLTPSERTQQRHVQTAVRARCLAQSNAPREALTLHLNGDGTVSALEYASNCSAEMTGTQLPQGWQLKQELPVHVKWPPRADILRPIARPQTGPGAGKLSGIPFDASLYGSPLQGQDPQQPGQRQQQGAAKTSTGADGKKKGPPAEPDNRSWIQKNWLFLVPLGLMMLNMMLGGETGGGNRQGARGAAAPAGRGR